MEVKNIKISHNIPASLLRKEQAERIVLILHGIFTDRHSDGRLTRLAERLYQADLSSIRIDLSGHGENIVNGKNNSVSKMICDIFETIEWLKKQGFQYIDLVASSFSGALISLFMKVHPNIKLNSLVMLNPVLDFTSSLLNPECKEIYTYLPKEAIIQTWQNNYIELSHGHTINRVFLCDLTLMDVTSAYLMIKQKHLIIFGTDDELLSYDTAKSIAENNSYMNWFEIKGAKHSFIDKKHEAIVQSKTIKWILNVG